MKTWRALFAFAVLRLGLAPGAVWALSVGEWTAIAEAAAAAGAGADGLDGAALEHLLQQYPDETS